MHEVLVNRLGGLSLPRKSVVRLTDRPDMTLDVYRGRKTTMQQCNLSIEKYFSLRIGKHKTPNRILPVVPQAISDRGYIGVKVPITSSVYGYTKVLARNLNSKKTSGTVIG